MVRKGEIVDRFDTTYYSALNTLDIANNTTYPVKKLSEVALLQRGKFSHRPRNDARFYDGEYPFIQTGDIVKASQNNDIIIFTQTLNELGLSVSKLFQPDILIITIAANIGDTAILTYPACFPDSLVTIMPKNAEVTVRYLNVYFKYVKDYLVNLAPQSAQKNINLQQLSPTPVVIPPPDIQDNIVSIFENAYIQKQQKEAEAAALLASIDGYLLQALGITLPPPSEKKTYFISRSNHLSGVRFDPFYHQVEYENIDLSLQNSNEKVYTLGHLTVDLKNGAEFRTYSDSGYRYLRVSDLSQHGITNKNMRFVDVPEIPERLKLNHDCILISRSGSLGLVNVVTDEIMDSILSSHIFKVQLNTKLVLPSYLENYLRSIVGQKQIFRNNNGGVIPELNQSALRSIKIVLPSIEKQTEIADHISALRTQAKQLQQQAADELAHAKLHVEQLILGVKNHDF